MKYVLVDKSFDVVSTTELEDGIGISGARTYFIGIKRIDEDNFDDLWKVMSKKEYDLNKHAFERKPSSQTYGIEWWKEDKDIVDDELKGGYNAK
jgi:hypothetical protein